MGDTLLNGRLATDFELAAIEHDRECDLERDRGAARGPADRVPPPAGHAVAAGVGPHGAVMTPREERVAAARRRAAAALIRCMDQRDQAGADAILARHAGDADAVAAWVWRIEAERAALRRVYRASPGWRSDRDAAGMRIVVAVRELVEVVAAAVARPERAA